MNEKMGIGPGDMEGECPVYLHAIALRNCGRGGVYARSQREVAQRPMGGGLAPVMRCGRLCAAVSVEGMVSECKQEQQFRPSWTRDDDAKILTPPRRKKINGARGLADQEFLYPT